MVSRTGRQIAAWAGATLAGFFVMACGQDIARADWRLTPGLTVQERFDGNPRFSATQKSPDFATVVNTTFEFKGREQEIDVSGNLGSSYTAYAKNTDLSRISSLGAVSLNANSLAGRLLPGWGLTVSENYISTQDFPVFAQLGQTNTQASGGIQTGRFSTFGNTLGATTSYALSQRMQMTGGYTNSLIHFSSRSNLTNTISNVLTGGGSYAVSAQTSLLSDYIFSKFSFSGGNTTGTTTSTDTHAAVVGVKQQFAADLDMTAKVGGTYLPAQDRLTNNFDVGATKKYAATIVGVSLSRFVTASGGLAALVSTRVAQSIFVTHQITPALTATLSGDRATTKSVGVSTLDITSYGLSSTINYAFNRYVNLTASASYLRQDSQGLTATSLNRNQVTIGMTVTWP